MPAPRLPCPVVLALLLSAAPPAAAQVTITLDPLADQKPIDPRIYGVSFAGGEPALFAALKYPANRWGGNSTTRYNWKLHSSNKGADWVFLSIAGDDHAAEFDQAAQNGSEQLVTVPMIGWVSRASSQKLCSYPVDLFPGQDADAYGRVDYDYRGQQCGTGLRGGVSFGLSDDDKGRANVAIDTAFVADWIAEIRARWPGIHHYALDNEPVLWIDTHRDVAGDSAGNLRQLTAAQLWDRTVTYARAIKQADPDAKVFGPVEWGWCGYFAGNGATTDLDGCSLSTDFIAWYLDQVKKYHDEHGVLLVDYLDLHYYPQSGEYTGDEGSALAATRLRSVKDLYDPAYDNESWIADTIPGSPKAVALIPRMKRWIADHAPGLGIKTAITEYNWGTNEGITAALAQAEILSIFARQGLDAGYRWTAPGSDQPLTQDAFRMYLDYDGAGGRVIGTSIQSTSSAVDTVAGYGVVNGASLLVALFNKSTAAQTATVNLQHGALTQAAGAAWGFGSSARYGQVGSVTPSGAASFTVSLPARSARLVRLALTGAVEGTCGDGACQASESSASCPADCGQPGGGAGGGGSGTGGGGAKKSGCTSGGAGPGLWVLALALGRALRRRRR